MYQRHLRSTLFTYTTLFRSFSLICNCLNIYCKRRSGTVPFKIFFRAFLGLSWHKLLICFVSESVVSSGSMSKCMVIASFRFICSLTTNWEHLNTAGPEIPKSVKIISIVCVIIGLSFLFNTDKATLLKDKPCKVFSFIKDSLDVKATSVGNKSVMVCPAFFAQAYPSPVEPVCGTDFPPTAMITEVVVNFSPFDKITVWKSSL